MRDKKNQAIIQAEVSSERENINPYNKDYGMKIDLGSHIWIRIFTTVPGLQSELLITPSLLTIQKQAAGQTYEQQFHNIWYTGILGTKTVIRRDDSVPVPLAKMRGLE